MPETTKPTITVALVQTRLKRAGFQVSVKVESSYTHPSVKPGARLSSGGAGARSYVSLYWGPHLDKVGLGSSERIAREFAADYAAYLSDFFDVEHNEKSPREGALEVTALAEPRPRVEGAPVVARVVQTLEAAGKGPKAYFAFERLDSVDVGVSEALQDDIGEFVQALRADGWTAEVYDRTDQHIIKVTGTSTRPEPVKAKPETFTTPDGITLTPAQADAWKRLQEGELHAGYGISLRTVQSLVEKGLATYTEHMSDTLHHPSKKFWIASATTKPDTTEENTAVPQQPATVLAVRVAEPIEGTVVVHGGTAHGCYPDQADDAVVQAAVRVLAAAGHHPAPVTDDPEDFEQTSGFVVQRRDDRIAVYDYAAGELTWVRDTKDRKALTKLREYGQALAAAGWTFDEMASSQLLWVTPPTDTNITEGTSPRFDRLATVRAAVHVLTDDGQRAVRVVGDDIRTGNPAASGFYVEGSEYDVRVFEFLDGTRVMGAQPGEEPNSVDHKLNAYAQALRGYGWRDVVASSAVVWATAPASALPAGKRYVLAWTSGGERHTGADDYVWDDAQVRAEELRGGGAEHVVIMAAPDGRAMPPAPESFDPPRPEQRPFETDWEAKAVACGDRLRQLTRAVLDAQTEEQRVMLGLGITRIRAQFEVWLDALEVPGHDKPNGLRYLAELVAGGDLTADQVVHRYKPEDVELSAVVAAVTGSKVDEGTGLRPLINVATAVAIALNTSKYGAYLHVRDAAAAKLLTWVDTDEYGKVERDRFTNPLAELPRRVWVDGVTGRPTLSRGDIAPNAARRVWVATPDEVAALAADLAAELPQHLTKAQETLLETIRANRRAVHWVDKPGKGGKRRAYEPASVHAADVEYLEAVGLVRIVSFTQNRGAVEAVEETS